MVNIIVNGDFSAGDNGFPDRDPPGWTVSEDDPNNVYVVGDALTFSGANLPPGAVVEQVVSIPEARLGETITFSFDYSEIGQQPANDVSLLAEVLDAEGNVVESIPVTDPGSAPSVSFTAESTSYTIRFTDTSPSSGISHDAQIDNVVFDVTCYASGTLIATEQGETLFPARDRTGNVAGQTDVYPDREAPIIRYGADGPEIARARWGMPVILRTPDEWSAWMTLPWAEARAMQRSLPDGALQMEAV